MPGVKGMKRKKSTRGTGRAKAWQSMRILKHFSIPDLCRTSGARVNNMQRYLRQLSAHGFVAQTGVYKGGRPGSSKYYRLVRDTGPNHPVWCDVCKQPLTARQCLPMEETNDAD